MTSPTFFLPPPLLPKRQTFLPRKILTARSDSDGNDKFELPVPKRARPLKSPTEVPRLLRNPEAVLAASAAGVFVLVRLAYRSVSNVVTSLTARIEAESRAHTWSEHIAAKQREILFLESAILSTKTTLQNTQSFLVAQKARVEAAEARLSQLGASRERLDAAVDEAHQRKKELTILEYELSAERENVKVNEGELVRLREAIYSTRAELTEFQARIQDERDELRLAEFSQQGKLNEARKQTARLETMVVEKEMELQVEAAERNRHAQAVMSSHEDICESSGMNKEGALDLGADRKQISNTEMQLQVLQSDLFGKFRNAGGDLESSDNRPEAIDVTLERVREQQETVRALMDEVRFAEIEKSSPSLVLRNEIAAHAGRLKLVHTEAPASEHAERVSTDRMHAGTVRYIPEGTSNVGERPRVAEKVSAAAPVVPALNDAVHIGSARGAAAERNMRTTLPLVEVVNSEQPPKRRRGRPRKNSQSPLTDTASAKPKRGRGRPRKATSPLVNVSEQPLKKKRGRPKKTDVSALATSHVDT